MSHTQCKYEIVHVAAITSLEVDQRIHMGKINILKYKIKQVIIKL